jgi:Fe-S-cluster-containing hydrogenase component 2
MPQSPGNAGLLSEFVTQGLYQGQSIVVLDLERCTRCDECVKACADGHGGVTRLVREGPRFDRFLVAICCRSCHDPYCLNGCPVDAIHRGKTSLEIRIEDHCIGCGLCADNCPYGSIHMVPKDESLRSLPFDPHARLKAEIPKKATNCDLCTNLGSIGPRCVYACPHDACFRLTGDELLEKAREDK